jgi:DNA-binding MarR family transcriptional regulator
MSDRHPPIASTASDADQIDLVDALAQSAFVVLGSLTRIAARYDLSLTQLRLLGILRDRVPRIIQLAQMLGLDKSSVSGLIERASSRGLVERVRSTSDRRAVDVRITVEGQVLIQRIYSDVRDALAPLTGSLTLAEQQRLSTLMKTKLQ